MKHDETNSNFDEVETPHDPTSRKIRQATLRRILQTQELTSQIDALNALKTSGVLATQSSVSRDFRELGVVKVSGKYQLPQDAQEELAGRFTDPFLEVQRFVHKVRTVSDHLLVIKTSAAAAHVVASLIDHLQDDKIAGTVAGDDTIFVATMNREAQLELEKYLLG